MRVFHGSFAKFNAPCLSKSKDYRDFGNGFYVTENYFDALSILKGREGYIYEYNLNLEGLSIKTFQSDDEVFNYIFRNRTEKTREDKYDIIIGKTASGNCCKVFKEIRNKGIKVSKNELKGKILDKHFGEQICIKTKKGLSKLILVDVHNYNREDFI